MQVDLSGKVALVTGAARGIGEAVALGLAEAGAQVVAHDVIVGGGLKRVQAELGASRCGVLAADLADPGVVAGLFEQALGFWGKIDILVNNAGVYEPAPVTADLDIWAAAWTRTLNINLLSAAHLCREAIRHFEDRGSGGAIINISSRAGFRGDMPDYMHYAASKGALLALTRTIARGYGEKKILAFAVAPGFVRTELNAGVFQTLGEQHAIEQTPLGEIALPRDVANLVVFLASDLARHMTGATVDINGASYVR